MNKTENPIKFIYVTTFNSDTLTFTTKRLKVVRENSRYVSLDDGNRIETRDICDLYRMGYRYRNIAYMLPGERMIYSLKPMNEEAKSTAKKEYINALKESIIRDKRWLEDKKISIKELKDKIAEQEARLAKLLKL